MARIEKAALKRMITQPRSRMTRINIVRVMKRSNAWADLTPESKARLYALLPQPKENETEYDTEQHPLQCKVSKYINTALVQWQSDLRDSRETKKFREHKITTTAEDMPLEESSESSSPGSTAEVKEVPKKKKKKK